MSRRRRVAGRRARGRARRGRRRSKRRADGEYRGELAPCSAPSRPARSDDERCGGRSIGCSSSALQTGRIRAFYGPGGEQAALRALPEASERLGADRSPRARSPGARARWRARALESVTVTAVGPGAFTRLVRPRAVRRSRSASTGRAPAWRAWASDMDEKRYYMACLDLSGRSVLVVGGGRVALEKVHGLLDAGATRDGRRAAGRPRARAARRRADPPGVSTRRPGRAVSSWSSQRRRPRSTGASIATPSARSILCNVVDVPELCSFILPAVHRQDPIAIAISTGGASPALAQRLRDDVAAVIRPEHAALARQLRELRPWAKTHFPTYEARRDHFQALVEEALSVTVHLVGAGPGDPGLITVADSTSSATCDALVHDVLVAPELVAEAPPDALVVSRARNVAGGGRRAADRRSARGISTSCG